jgi:DNA polymerase I-like protein with 3'-5' exonuclease and polymerase domains
LSARKVELTQQLQAVFPPAVSQVQLKTKVRTDVIPFNPGSRIQIAERLQGLGWVPVKFTESTAKLAPHLRRAKVDPDSLLTCDLPEVKPILEYLETDKRLGQIANGENAWLKLVTPDGKIHGQVNTVGAVTSRVSHSRPNMSAVPRVVSFLGAECRNLFHARPGWSLVGADLAGIELRTLAHYTWSFDGGAYAEHVLNGDIHTVHQQAFGLPEGKEWRSIGKTGTYCLIYGGGDWKLGFSLGYKGTEAELVTAGKQSRARLMKSLPALNSLIKAIQHKRGNQNNMLRGLDGRPLYCRSSHSALNTICQSAGAIIAKVWYNLINLELSYLGYIYGEDYETYGFYHDEVQLGCRPEIADVVGAVTERMAIKAGESLGFELPVNAEYKVGYTWEDTH